MKAIQCALVVLLFRLLTISKALNLQESNTRHPEIIEGPTNAVAAEISAVILKCRASGNPKPKIEWETDGSKVQNKRYEVLPSGDLKIEPVYFYDAGEYTCKAENENGIVNKSAILEVKQRTQVYIDEMFKEFVIGQTAWFRCEVRNDDSLSVDIEWLKNNKPIDYNNQPRIAKLNDNSLRIVDTIEADTGEYTCVARSPIDEAKDTATLVVVNVPIAPVLEDVSCNDLVAEIVWKPLGDKWPPILFYSVEYNTSFTPQKWEVGAGAERVPTSSSKHTFLMNPWNSYSFRVRAHNKIGQSDPSENSKICTTPPDVPYKNPENVRAEGTNPTNMIISWTTMPEIDHNGPKFQYRVFWKRDIPESNWESKDIIDWQINKVVVNDLPIFERYHVKVVAINEIGESKFPAVEVMGYSGEAPPLLAPSNFKMIDLRSSTTAFLQWDAIDHKSIRGHFLGYKVQTWAADESEESLREVKVANNVNQIIFQMLRPYSKNYVRLLAYNSLFDGPSTVISIDTPEGVPSSVQNLEAHVLSPTDVLLTWDKPLRPNGQLTGYRIFYQKIQDYSAYEKLESFPVISDPLVTSGKLTELRPDTKYRITVIAKTAMKDGEEYYLETKTLQPSTARSQKPSKANFKLEPLTSIIVTWQPFNGVPTGTHFFTQYRQKGDVEWHNMPEEKYNTNQIVDRLNRDTVYEFRVVSVDGNYQTESEIQEIKTL